MSISYTVTASLPDEPTRERYLTWILEGHAQAVVRGGASSARVLRLDADPSQAQVRLVAEVRYEFESRAALERYLRDFAPALRAEGLALFPPESGIVIQRRVGEIVGTVGEV